MKLTLMMSNRCNARCAHCVTSSSPEDRLLLAPDEIRDWIDQARAISKSLNDFSVCFSGGEPFLYLDALLELIQYANQRGAKTTCVSNAFWAGSRHKARTMVAQLKKAGLASLCLSHDQFHRPYVPFRNVAAAVQACAEHSLHFSLKYVSCNGAPRMTTLLEKLEHLTIDQTFSVNEIACLPLGRAKNLPAAGFVRRKAIPSNGCAWLGTFVINEAGNLYPCCTPDWPQQLCLGNMRSSRLSDLVKKAKRNPLLVILHGHGPVYFVPFMRKAGIRFTRGSFVNECHLCNSILATAAERPEAQLALGTAIREWKAKRKQEKTAAETIRKMLG